MQTQIRISGRRSTTTAAASSSPSSTGLRARGSCLTVYVKQVRDRKIGTRVTPLVIESALAGYDQGTAAAGESPDGRALRVGESAHVRENENSQPGLAIDI